MTQDKDREELLEILEGKIIECVDVTGDGKKFIQKLLRWKRGDKWWCEHMDFIKSRDDYDYSQQDSVMTRDWKVCPICGTPRPT